MNALEAVGTWGRMVKFGHSIFALPFAFAGVTLAGAEGGIDLGTVLWVAVAMVAARNAAMGFNRLVDREIDAQNPRTAGREIPSGQLSPAAVTLFTIGLALLFVVAAFQLNRMCGLLSPIALAVVFGYSYTKRFTWGSHLVLGLALAIAPVGGWVAVRGGFSPIAWWLAAAVLLWVAGFDVIYACQDAGFDRDAGLHSMPARFGIPQALWIARGLHLAALGAMAGVGLAAELHPVYWVGVAGIAGLLAWEHRLVRADDLSKIGVAFFTMNGVISVLYFAVVLTAVLLGRR